MSFARALLLLVEELSESLDAAAGRREAAARRWLRWIENCLAAAALRLQIRRLEARLDDLRIAACRQWADARRIREGEEPACDSIFAELRGVGRRLDEARRNLEERLR